MPWNDITRQQHNRDNLRYPSDLTEAEWVLVAPFIPPAKPGGRPRTADMREVMNAILSIAGGGIQWRMLPKDFPPVSTVRGYFYAWRNAGLWQTINHVLVMATRNLEGREAQPTAGVIDSQSVKTTESDGSREEPVLGRAIGPTRGTRARRSRAANATSLPTRSG